jgi:hypothetical protein
VIYGLGEIAHSPAGLVKGRNAEDGCVGILEKIARHDALTNDWEVPLEDIRIRIGTGTYLTPGIGRSGINQSGIVAWIIGGVEHVDLIINWGWEQAGSRPRTK